MAGVTAHGGVFAFSGFTAYVTSLSVETPTAAVVDMTGTNVTSAAQMILVPSGAWSGGSVTVDYIHAPGGADPYSVVRTVGNLTFSSPGYSVTRRAILESATTSASTGELVRGTLKFRLTDYQGS